ncbi:M28 family peptidase [Brevibacillus reuszeri]|uniref:M28 family peptidase n=1 Tax=Brevibacillus reuszeri TaxID=54915 RepID=UPI00289C54B1|nr:M28 family peptidase [Brevibacillus reuszeri]
MRSVRYFAISALLAWGMTLLPVPFTSEVSAKALPEWIDEDNLSRHMEHLARLPRPPATETEFAAGAYVEETLRSYGYQTSLQPFYYYTYRKPSTLSFQVEGSTQSWNPSGLAFGPNGVATAPIVDSGQGTATDFENGKARGNIAFVKRGSITFAEKVRQAAAAGAVAVIIWNDRESEWKGTLVEPLDMSVPVIALSKEQGLLLQKQLQANQQVKATVKVEGSYSSKETSSNFVATRKPAGGGTGQIVMVTAHHDSTPSSPGANYGAAGLAVMLELARTLAERPIDTEIRFVSFGAVSAGEKGPHAYVSSLTKEEKEKIIAAYSLDGVGSQDAKELLVTTVQRTKNLPVQLAEKAGARFSTAVEDQVSGFREDRVFAQEDIPSAIITRPPVNHLRNNPDDTAEKISLEQLTKTVQMMFAAVTQITDSSTSAYPIVKERYTVQRAVEEEEI